MLKNVLRSSPSFLSSTLLRSANKVSTNVNGTQRDTFLNVRHKIWYSAMELRIQHHWQVGQEIRKYVRCILSLKPSTMGRMKYLFDIIKLIKQNYTKDPRLYGYDDVRYRHNIGMMNIEDMEESKDSSDTVSDLYCC